jgi:hypothetical protein
MPFESSSVRLWRALDRPLRDRAARAFWQDPPQEAAALAVQEIVKLLRVRPQALPKVPVAQRASALAALAQPPEALAESLLVALHLECRRELLADFLDSLGITHEQGLLAEDAEFPPPEAEQLEGALSTLRAKHPDDAIRLYWNALWIQDPERWAALSGFADALAAAPAG